MRYSDVAIPGAIAQVNQADAFGIVDLQKRNCGNCPYTGRSPVSKHLHKVGNCPPIPNLSKGPDSREWILSSGRDHADKSRNTAFPETRELAGKFHPVVDSVREMGQKRMSAGGIVHTAFSSGKVTVFSRDHEISA